LVPRGLYRFVEESTRDIEENTPEGDDAEIVLPTAKEMANSSMWVHHSPSILNQGRTKHADPKVGPGDEDVEPEDLMKREVD
jgi:hypothetical protein